MALILIALPLFFIFPKFEYFPSQNAAYHALMARRISGEFDQIPLLPTSAFSNFFIDQHLGLHYLVKFLNPYFGAPWETLRFIQILFLSLFFIGSAFFINRQSNSFWVGCGWFGFSLFFANTLLNRIYFLRIESLILASIVGSILSAHFLFSRKTSWIWYLIFFLSISYSWINFTLILIPVWMLKEQPKKLIKHMLLIFVLTVLSFILRGDPIDILKYFQSLLHFTLFSNSGIREWESSNVSKTWPYLLFFFLNFVVALLSLRKRSVSKDVELTFLFTIGISVAAVFFNRFMTGAYFLNMLLCGICVGSWLNFHSQKRYLEKFVFALGGIFLLGYWHNRPDVFVRWNSEVHNYYQTIQSFGHLEVKPKKVVISKWEHWSILSWHLPNVIFEPGLSTLIYRDSAPLSLKCIFYFRAHGNNLNFFDVQKCLQNIRKEFDTDYFLLDSKFSQAIDFLKSYPDLGTFIFINSDGSLFKIGSSFDLNSILSMREKDYPIINLHDLNPNFLIMENGLFGSFDFKRNAFIDPNLSQPGSLLRSIMSAWVFCRAEILPRKRCEEMFEQYQMKVNSDSNLGTQAMLGLLAIYLDRSYEAITIQKQISNQILSNGLFAKVNYGKRDSIFYPGEALLFLYKSLNYHSSPDLLAKINRAYYYYWFQYHLTKNPFYIRWLSEVIAVRKKNLGLNIDYEAKFIRYELTQKWPQYCPLLLAQNSDLTWAGLLLEGGVHLFDRQTTQLMRQYYICAKGAIRYAQKSGNLYFAIRDSVFLARDDIFAHSFGGMYYFLNGSPYSLTSSQ